MREHLQTNQLPTQSNDLHRHFRFNNSKALFLYKFILSPAKIGSIIPSSNYLAQAMIKPIDWSNTSAIVELGAGTGVFTSYIHRNKSQDCQGIIFEQDNSMRRRLVTMYPDLHYCSRAEDVSQFVKMLGISQVDYVISGLPFTNFSRDLCNRILDGVTNVLKPGGLFIAFQYSSHMKKNLLGRFFRVECEFVPLNIPPALVYYCYKQ